MIFFFTKLGPDGQGKQKKNKVVKNIRNSNTITFFPALRSLNYEMQDELWLMLVKCTTKIQLPTHSKY